VLINTDGWVADRRALLYKARLVESTEPDALVVMEGTGASEALARVFENTKIRVVRAPTPPAAKGKERELRKMRRELSYLDLLGKATVKQVKLKDIRLWGAYTFNGRHDPKLSAALTVLMGFEVYVEDCGNAVVLVASDEQACRKLQDAKEQLAKLLNKEVYVSCLSGVKGVIVGLVDERLEHVGVGVLEGIDVKEGVVKLRTPFEVEGVRALILGRLKISEGGVERERGTPPLA